MNLGTTCKFCRKPITVEVGEGYDAIGDHEKLVPLLCCNRCADLRTERKSLEAKVKFSCTMLYLAGGKISTDKLAQTRGTLERVLKQYASMIARWHFMQGMAWDDECLNLIMDKPDHWPSILRELWKMFADCNPERVGTAINER